MSVSFTKTRKLLEEDKVKEAAQEFRTGFATHMKKLYSEAAETPPKRYEDDCDWNPKVKKLYIKTSKAQAALNKGDAEGAEKQLDAIRTFFYKLHTENKIRLTSDAIHAFMQEVNKASKDDSLTEGEIAALNKLISEIPKASPSRRAKAKTAEFKKDLSEWSTQVSTLLAQAPVATEQNGKLKEVTAAFYRKYGLDLE
jgi:outer membrane protein assembly factor BamD (BamD/ComL family)